MTWQAFSVRPYPAGHRKRDSFIANYQTMLAARVASGQGLKIVHFSLNVSTFGGIRWVISQSFSDNSGSG